MDYSQSRSILDSYESTEHALLDSFKAAAVRVTNLYKDAMGQNRKAFGAGYQQALQDIFEFINTHNGSFTGIPAQSGVVAVDDLVGFARNKSAQLALELGSENAAAAASAEAVAVTIPKASSPSQSHRQEGEQEQDSSTLHNRSSIANNTTAMATATTTATAVDKSPFHIDPAAQFTFSAPLPPSLPRHGWTSSSPWATPTQPEMDSLKRRHTELTFMGRPLSNMDVDGSCEPAYKRGKPKQ